MQVQFNHIAGGKRLLWQVGEKEFVHHTCPRDANGAFLFARRMGGEDPAAGCPFGSHRNLRAIVEAAHHLAFGTLLELIGGRCKRA